MTVRTTQRPGTDWERDTDYLITLDDRDRSAGDPVQKVTNRWGNEQLRIRFKDAEDAWVTVYLSDTSLGFVRGKPSPGRQLLCALMNVPSNIPDLWFDDEPPYSFGHGQPAGSNPLGELRPGLQVVVRGEPAESEAGSRYLKPLSFRSINDPAFAAVGASSTISVSDRQHWMKSPDGFYVLNPATNQWEAV